MDMDLEVFLERNRIDRGDWDRSGCDWGSLKLIADDHESNKAMLEQTVGMHAAIIQGIAGVHSVRWRIKDAEHVLEKIVRKKAAAEPKYEHVSVDTYKEIITDLIGLRALHLFKEDCFAIHKHLVEIFEMDEPAKAYIREGDPADISNRYIACGMQVAQHNAGYRSIHYIISSKPLKDVVKAEIQVRTLFEEGWSEIDHRIRYPNYSDNELIKYFLQIFNRLAGSADEMGSFVSELERSVSENKKQFAEYENQQASSFERAEGLMQQLEFATDQVAAIGEERDSVKQTLKKLQQEIESLKSESLNTVTIENLRQYRNKFVGISASDVRKFDILLSHRKKDQGTDPKKPQE